MNNPIKAPAQQGMATLLVVIVVLVITTLMVFFAAKVGIFDQRMAGNEARYKEAFAAAEAGLEMSIEKFQDQFATNYTGVASWPTVITNSAITAGTETDGTTADTGEPSFGVTITNTGVIGGVNVYQFAATGVSGDGTGSATVSREVTMKNILGGTAPEVPVVVSGSVGTGGNFNIAANSNGGGNGIPVSVWTGPPGTGANVNFNSGSAATCHREDFDTTLSQPTCSNPGGGGGEKISSGQTSPALSTYNSAYPDILPNDANFPTDLFRFLFGVVRADWLTVYNMADSNNQVISDCSTLNATSGQNFRLWWVTADCNLDSNQVIGSQTDPVILVIDDRQLDIGGGGAAIYGLVFLFNNPCSEATRFVNPCTPATTPTPSADFHGSSTIFGSLVSDIGGTAMSGSYSIVYDPTINSNLTTANNSANFDIAFVPGSWRDF